VQTAVFKDPARTAQ